MICDECETVAHCLKNGCLPKQPALKPLTDEEIMKVWQPVARKIFGIAAEGHSMDVYGIENASMILHLSRAIEAAHGITAAPTTDKKGCAHQFVRDHDAPRHECCQLCGAVRKDGVAAPTTGE